VIRCAQKFFAIAGALALVDCVESTPLRPTSAEVASRCAGISEAQTNTLVDDLRNDVDRIEIVRERSQKPSFERLVGVELHVRASRGMTAQWLSRSVTCHAMREASGVPCNHGECPFAIPNLTADVRPTQQGFSVVLRSNESMVRELERRAHVSFEARRSAKN